MNRKSLSFYLVLTMLLLTLAACSGEAETEGVSEAATPTAEPVGVPVEVAAVDTGSVSLIYNYNGNLESVDDINVLPSASGKIMAVMVEEGDFVKQGDPLALIEQDIYKSQLSQTEAALKTAQLELAKMTLGSRPAEIATAQAAVELAKAALDDTATIDDNERTRAAANLARAQANLEVAQKAYDEIAWAGDVGQKPQARALEVATIAYEDALANYNLDTNISDAALAPLMLNLAQAELNLALTLEPFREVDFAIAQTRVDQAKAGVEIAQNSLENTVIEAPFDGIVTDLFVTEGSSVGPQTPVARFVTREVEVEINVEEGRVGQIAPGQFAGIRVPAFPGQDFPAVVKAISQVANKDTRTFSVTVEPREDEGLLRSGMFASVSLLVEEKDDVTITPFTSISINENDEEIVYVVDQTGQAQVRNITTGISDNERVEVVEGLQPGDTVVVVGQRNLSDGALVEVVNN